MESVVPPPSTQTPAPARHRSSIKTPLPKIHHNSSQQQRLNAFIFQRTINTLTTSSVLTFFWTPFSKQFRLLFPADFVSPPLSPRVWGRQMKGRSQRSMGETYHGVSQPFHREASYKEFRAAAAVATRELPSVIKPPQVRADAPVCLFARLFFCLPFFSSTYYHNLINIQLPTSGLVSPPFQVSFIRALFLLALLFLSTSFPFPSSLLSFMVFCFFYVRRSVI